MGKKTPQAQQPWMRREYFICSTWDATEIFKPNNNSAPVLLFVEGRGGGTLLIPAREKMLMKVQYTGKLRWPGKMKTMKLLPLKYKLFGNYSMQ